MHEPTTSPEVAGEPGCTIERRHLLTFASSVLLGAAATVRPAFAALADEVLATPASERIGLDAFLAEVVPVAKALVADGSAVGQDRYLHALAMAACRLADLQPPELRPSGQGEGASIGVHPGGDPFVVLHWKLEPGARIRPHAHTYGNVVTVGLAGDCVVRHWDVEGERHADAGRPVRVRCTRARRLVFGGIDLVSLEHDCVHGFVAGELGARGLDITTRLRDKQPTPYLDLGQGDEARVGEVFETAWVFDG